MRYAVFSPAERRKTQPRKLHVQRVNLFVADVTQGIQGAVRTDAGPLTQDDVIYEIRTVRDVDNVCDFPVRKGGELARFG